MLLADGYFMMFCRFYGGLFYLKDDRGIFIDSAEICFTQPLSQNRLLYYTDDPSQPPRIEFASDTSCKKRVVNNYVVGISKW